MQVHINNKHGLLCPSAWASYSLRYRAASGGPLRVYRPLSKWGYNWSASEQLTGSHIRWITQTAGSMEASKINEKWSIPIQLEVNKCAVGELNPDLVRGRDES